MPLYEYVCPEKHRFERYLAFADYQTPQTCACGSPARRVISLPMIFVQKDIHYDSPIDGRPITSMAARKEDLARSGCMEYDPEMKTDQKRRIAAQDKALEETVGATVDEEIARMPARKRERLAAEMEGGMDVTPERITPNVKPLKVEIDNG